MATIWVPSLMRDLAGGLEQVDVPGRTVGQAIDALDRAYPGIRDRLCDGGRIDTAIAVWVDGRIARLGLEEGIGERSEIYFLPAVAGG